MKISDNTLAAIQQYFNDELNNEYEQNEIKVMFRLMMKHYFNFSSTDLVLSRKHRFSESELLKVIFCVKKLKNHQPLAYILGETEFYGLKFKVNQDVLIPRAETEELVDWIIREVGGIRNLSILDIGTGSACIPIALKKQLPNAVLSAFDISERAIEVAIENALLNDVDIIFSKVDILHPKVDANLKWDIIVSNPPYITVSEKHKMEKNVLNYEPHLALFVDDADPLLFYRKIIEFSKKHLNKEGLLFFEINQYLGKETLELLQKHFRNVELRKDINGNDRMAKGQFIIDNDQCIINN